jgi:DNA topoisomerase VI subunit B
VVAMSEENTHKKEEIIDVETEEPLHYSNEKKENKQKCVDFLLVKTICEGDFVIIKSGIKSYIGEVIQISPYAMVLKQEDGTPTILRFKYISTIEVIAQHDNKA